MKLLKLAFAVYLAVVCILLALLLAAQRAEAQTPACWPKDITGGTGSAAIVMRALLTTGAVRESDDQSCAVAWACSSVYSRDVQVAVFDKCTAALDSLKTSAMAALAEARSVPAYASLVMSKCPPNDTTALCAAAAAAVVSDPLTPAPPAFAASAPTLYDTSNAVIKELLTVTGAACDCASTSTRRVVGKELRCELAGAKSPPGVFAACNKK